MVKKYLTDSQFGNQSNSKRGENLCTHQPVQIAAKIVIGVVDIIVLAAKKILKDAITNTTDTNALFATTPVMSVKTAAMAALPDPAPDVVK